MSEFGVVSSFDSQFFKMGLLMIRSVRLLDESVPVFVYDTGLTEDEVKTLDAIGVATTKSSASSFEDRTFVKPYAMIKSGFTNCLWMDADTIAVKGFGEIKERTMQGFWVCRSPNHKKKKNMVKVMFDAFPCPGMNPIPPSFNNGVMGMSMTKDIELVSAWLYADEVYRSNKHVKQNVCFYDQGTLTWAIRFTGRHDCVLPHSRYNRTFVGDSEIKSFVKMYDIDDPNIIDIVKQHFPDDNIVHFAGRTKIGSRFIKERIIPVIPKKKIIIDSRQDNEQQHGK